MELKFDNAVYVYPWIDGSKLMIDVDSEDTQSVGLLELFGEYMSYFRLMDGTIAPEHSKEIRNTVALLRLIAREMETEVEGSRE